MLASKLPTPITTVSAGINPVSSQGHTALMLASTLHGSEDPGALIKRVCSRVQTPDIVVWEVLTNQAFTAIPQALAQVNWSSNQVPPNITDVMYIYISLSNHIIIKLHNIFLLLHDSSLTND